MRHMDVYMEQEEKYTEAVMAGTERLQSKLQSEMASRLAFDLSTPPLRWGPWYVFFLGELFALVNVFVADKKRSLYLDYCRSL